MPISIQAIPKRAFAHPKVVSDNWSKIGPLVEPMVSTPEIKRTKPKIAIINLKKFIAGN